VKLPLDTHVLIWYFQTDPKMSSVVLAAIRDRANTVYVSAASHWEIAIKVSTGKLILQSPFPDFVQFAILDQGFTLLPIEPRHTAAVAAMPFPPNHRDPFDRMLVAQAQTDGLVLLSADARLDAYGVTRIW
jgi:PIN domain nuclease of toxin-antitoxin system